MDPSTLLVNVLFYVFAAAVVAGALGVALSRNIVRSAFCLLAVLFGAAALYAMMKADFIAAAQVLIYVGGILVLIIFAVMLTHRITDVNVSNESTPGPAALCACLCMLFALVVVILFAARFERDPEAAVVRLEGHEVRLRQYQGDGATGLAWGGDSVEDRVVLEVEVVPPLGEAARVEFEVDELGRLEEEGETADEETSVRATTLLDDGGRIARKELVRLLDATDPDGRPVDRAEDRMQWRVRVDGLGDWVRRASPDADFTARRGVTVPAARALMGPYLLAFEVVSVLLLAALVGAAFLARKEVRA